MSIKFNWSCPYCNRDVTITNSNFSRNIHSFDNENKDGGLALVTIVITCPNDKCREYTIKGGLYSESWEGGDHNIGSKARLQWSMKPSSLAKQFPQYIPTAIVSDYEEACLIRDLSSKASATLSRRCLQGIIRDFWGVKKGRLVDEINSIKDKIDPITWQAINAVRSIGNIGAHMEKDINLIIEVEPQEAQLLIGLIEVLIKDWYITKHERQKNLENIIDVAGIKAEKKKSNNANSRRQN
jgi:hypothetical protein